MKTFFILFIFLFINISCIFPQTPDWVWAISAGGNENDFSNCITSDKYGYIYFSGTYNSDSITFYNYTLFNNSNPDMYGNIFITKLDLSGNIIWAKSAGGSDYDDVKGIVTDSYGNIYITGTFTNDSINFDNITLHNLGIVGNDIFVAKYDPLGNILWAKSGGNGESHDFSSAITCDKEDNIYITGRYELNSFIFDNDTLTYIGPPPSTYSDMYILKLNETGNILWGKTATGVNIEWGWSLTSDTIGNIYVCGGFTSPSVSLDSITLINTGDLYSRNVFIAKYNSSGEIQWANNIFNNVGGYNNKITSDIFNNIYITGSFYDSTIVFGNTTLINTSDTACDMFIVKYDSSGNFIWAKSANGVGWEAIQDFVSDIDGNVYITGTTNSPSVTFDTTTLFDFEMPFGWSYIVKYDSSGNLLWAKKSEGGNSGITNDNYGNTYITGLFADSINFDSITIYNSSLYFCDIFVAKLSGSASSINEFQSLNSIIIYPNPVSEYLNINFQNNPVEHTEFNIEITDISGRIIRCTTIFNKVSLNVSSLPSGVYIIKVYTDKDLAIGKFIKQ